MSMVLIAVLGGAGRWPRVRGVPAFRKKSTLEKARADRAGEAERPRDPSGVEEREPRTS